MPTQSSPPTDCSRCRLNSYRTSSDFRRRADTLPRTDDLPLLPLARLFALPTLLRATEKPPLLRLLRTRPRPPLDQRMQLFRSASPTFCVSQPIP